MFFITVGRFWSCASQVSSYQNVLERSSYAMVPAARRTFGLYRVLHAHRHVGRGLHFLWNGLRSAIVSGLHCWGRTSLNFQGMNLFFLYFWPFLHQIFLFWILNNFSLLFYPNLWFFFFFPIFILFFSFSFFFFFFFLIIF